jgi:mono/diheme cytochrome c family protein
MRILTTIGALLLSATFSFCQETIGTGAAVTAVAGESWLHHLHRSFDDTSMGKTWRLGPADLSIDQAAGFSRLSTQSDSTIKASETHFRTLHGSDLYRMNCQGCHGESGLGAPPEIASLIDPVRATSAVMIDQRMKKIGLAMSRRQTAEMANQSKAALLSRLHEGGTDMPSFAHLSEAEIRSLMAYLQQLAGFPGAQKKQVTIRASRARVGELIVKSTCHVCHGATGLDPTPAELSAGSIPALSVLRRRVNQAQLVRKVTLGAPAVGESLSVYRGRMPVFNYLSKDEAADIYEYLTGYPPIEPVQLVQAQPSLSVPIDSATDHRETKAKAPQLVPSQVPVSDRPADSFALPVAVAVFVVALMGLGFWFTVYECKRLSKESQARNALRRTGKAPAPWVTSRSRIEMVLEDPRLRAESLEREFSDSWE